MPSGGDLIDLAYEAAFTPDLWTPMLDRLAAASGSAAGSLLVFDEPGRPPLYRTTERTAAALAAFVAGDAWKASRRVGVAFDPRFDHLAGLRFFYAADYADVTGDSVDQALATLGLGGQITTVIPMPTGEIASFTFERLRHEGRHGPDQLETLNTCWPHLARAAMIAARLRLEQARAAASALHALGVPAAILSRAGRVRAANELLESMQSVFLPTAFGGMAIADPAANDLFRQAIETAGGAQVRSIPMRAAPGQPPMVVHVLPLIRSARDIFAGADIVVAATTARADAGAPSPSILTGLFDLSAAEARLAAALARGQSVKGFAAEAGLAFATARKYLDSVYAKTGTHRQNELVALIRGAQPFG